MLGQHPQLYDLLETQLFEVNTLQEWWDAFGEIHDSDGLSRSLAEVLLGSQSAVAIRVTREWLWRHRKRRTGELARMLSAKLFPLALVEKTPIESATEAAIRAKLRRRLRIFPKARFMHLTRNPVRYGVSHLEHLEKMARTGYPWRIAKRYEMMLDETRKPPAIDPQVLWFRVHNQIVKFLDEVPSEQKLLVRGEDLLSHPDSELRRIASAFGLACDTRAIEAMKHPDRSPFACLGPKNARFGGDPKFFRSPNLQDAQHVTPGLSDPLPWRNGLRLKPHVVDLARQLGYR
jgi:Sulfotransferase family